MDLKKKTNYSPKRKKEIEKKNSHERGGWGTKNTSSKRRN